MSQNFSHVPQRLPINFSTLNYLNTLTDTQEHLLNPKTTIELDTILQMTQK